MILIAPGSLEVWLCALDTKIKSEIPIAMRIPIVVLLCISLCASVKAFNVRSSLAQLQEGDRL